MEKNMTKIVVVMPTLIQFRMALEAVSTMSTKHDLEFVPICNWINGFSVAESWNHGMHLAKERRADYVFIVNDDILLAHGAIDVLVESMEKDNTIGIVTCRDYRKRFASSPHSIAGFTPEESYISDGPDFAAFMIRPAAYEDIGPFDEGFKKAYFEDNDYCHRTILKKWKCVSHMGAAFYHYGSQTQNGGPEPVVGGLQFELNRDHYMSKWGGPPGQEAWKVPYNASE